MTPDRHRILLADDVALFRAALRSALEDEAGFTIVGETVDVESTVAAMVEHKPQLAVVDVHLPGGGGFEACTRAIDLGLETRVVILAPDRDVQLLLQTLEAGAIGFATRQGQLADLVAALHDVAGGEVSVPPRMLGSLLHELINRRRAVDVGRDRLARLSTREREVLCLLGEGNDHESIARSLVISPQTARTHIQNVLNKLEVHSRVEAVALALEHGAVS
jgi:DNA-binding NarL/FixJ family response regulator